MTFLMPILARLMSLWRWLTESPVRLAFALLIALSAFLALRLSIVDGDRDKWRTRAEEYEAASRAVAEASIAADAEARDAAAQTKGTIDAGNDRAKAAAGQSDDPLRAGFDRLRAEKTGDSGKATR